MKRGFSLVEVMVSLTLLSLLSVFAFSVFAHGSSLFRLGSARGNLQSDMRRLMASVGREITHSSFYSVTCWKSPPLSLQAAPGQTLSVQRDLLACASLRDPLGAASYHPQSGLPQWDCYTVYLATQEVPEARLLRFRVDSPFDASGPSSEPAPLRGQRNGNPYDYLTSIQSAFPASSPDAPVLPNSTRLVSDRLLDFDVNPEPATQLVRVRVVLRAEEGRLEQGRRSTAELLEGKLVFRPENTWPHL